jgi:HD superfamily phosphohydrolase
MPSISSESGNSSHKRKIVVDSVHGDIEPNPLEWKIIDTPAFQRLRKLKQLQMGYLVYPNATHTRFAHSLGVLSVMKRILERVRATDDDKKDLRLAALMHDIGHYPYSHLLEGVDKVVLTEERLNSGSPKSALSEARPYPDHEEVGREILLHQDDLLKILGGRERAERIGHIFARTEVADQQLSKLIHSSLDMDRLDYLIRDSQATGVPYGLVDIHYLLNHVKQSPTGVIGITHKAVAAAEHLLLARSFLFRVVCQHKTTFGFEEAARQLLRRLRDRAHAGKEGYDIPKDGDAVLKIARDKSRLQTFTDAFLDEIFVKAASDDEPDEIVRILARALVSRRPPRLLWEKRTFRERDDDQNDGKLFLQNCQLRLNELVTSKGLLPGQFLICDLKPIGFESRGALMSKQKAEKALAAGEQEEMIRVFETSESIEPTDIVEIKHSILHEIGSHVFRTYRLYFICKDETQIDLANELKQSVKDWH